MYCNRCGRPHETGVCLRDRPLASRWSEVKQRLDAAKDGGSKLSDIDPFNDVPVDLDAAEPFAEEAAPKKAAVKKVAPKKEGGGDREGVTVTLKGGAGFDAPWIVIHAGDVTDAYEQLSGDNAAVLSKLMDRTRNAASHFVSLGGATTSTPAVRPGQEVPASVGEAPGPDWTYKTGVGKNGKTWKAWMPPRGSSESPVWL
jgi:hypothetical protein